MSRAYDESHFDNPAEERDWRLALYANVVENEQIRQRAWRLTFEELTPGDPRPTRGHFESARGYLLKLSQGKPIHELRLVNDSAWAAYWAHAARGRAAWEQQMRAAPTAPSHHARRRPAR